MENIKEKITNLIEKAKNSKKKIISILVVVIAAIIVLSIGINTALNMFSAEHIAKKSVIAAYEGNYKAYYRHSLLSAEEFIECFAKDEKEDFDEYLDDEGYDSVEEMLEDNAEEALDDWEDKFGEYEIEIKKIKADYYTRRELKSFKNGLRRKYGDYIDEDKISNAAEVEVKVRIVGEDDRDTNEIRMVLVKYKGFWKVSLPLFLDY